MYLFKHNVSMRLAIVCVNYISCSKRFMQLHWHWIFGSVKSIYTELKGLNTECGNNNIRIT